MDRTPSVLLLTDHAIAARDARASLGRVADVRRASLARPRRGVAADVVVLDQTLAEPPSGARLADLATRAGGAPIISAIADGTGRYRWLRVRAASGLFRIEAFGTGTLAEAVSEATRTPAPA